MAADGETTHYYALAYYSREKNTFFFVNSAIAFAQMAPTTL